MGKKTYSEKLRDPRRQKRRLEILQRDHFQCLLCGDPETELHIHHRYYTKNTEPWDYPDAALTTLCKHCHVIIGEVNPIELKIIRVLRSETQGEKEMLAVCEATNGRRGVALYRIVDDSPEWRFNLSDCDLMRLIELFDFPPVTDFKNPSLCQNA